MVRGGLCHSTVRLYWGEEVNRSLFRSQFLHIFVERLNNSNVEPTIVLKTSNRFLIHDRTGRPLNLYYCLIYTIITNRKLLYVSTDIPSVLISFLVKRFVKGSRDITSCMRDISLFFFFHFHKGDLQTMTRVVKTMFLSLENHFWCLNRQGPLGFKSTGFRTERVTLPDWNPFDSISVPERTLVPDTHTHNLPYASPLCIPRRSLGTSPDSHRTVLHMIRLYTGWGFL